MVPWKCIVTAPLFVESNPGALLTGFADEIYPCDKTHKCCPPWRIWNARIPFPPPQEEWRAGAQAETFAYNKNICGFTHEQGGTGNRLTRFREQRTGDSRNLFLKCLKRQGKTLGPFSVYGAVFSLFRYIFGMMAAFMQQRKILMVQLLILIVRCQLSYKYV